MKLAGRIAGLCLMILAGSASADPIQIKVEGGTVSGTLTNDVAAYRNIPFAAPPVGDLRWQPPQKAKPWSGLRDGARPGTSCIQPMRPDGTPNLGGANGPMSEDCLQLNVFAPKDAKKAPVMVWLHGGSHLYGAGWIFDGTHFARDGVILVAINYRLGPLGYFAHPALTKAARPGEPLANYGLMDQVAALKWVQRNIGRFGGDPKNVTLFGESAGGVSTLAVMALPQAAGLYQKAVVQSGLGWFAPVTLTQKEADGVALAGRLCLANATPVELRAAPALDLISKLGREDYGPIVDGTYMTLTPSQAFAAGKVPDVPLIIGTNSGEDSVMGSSVAEATKLLALMPLALRAAYVDEAGQGDEALIRAATRDKVMAGPARWIAAKTSDGAPSWLYYFSYVGSRFRPMGIKTAFHAAEIQYVFDYWGRRTPESQIANDDREMAKLMHGCWVAFARTGAPTCGAAWPAYDPKTDTLLEFGAESGQRSHFRKAQLDAQTAFVLPTLNLPK